MEWLIKLWLIKTVQAYIIRGTWCWVIFVVGTLFTFLSVFRHDYGTILPVSCLSGLAWCWCSLDLFMSSRRTPQLSYKGQDAPSNATASLTVPGEFPLSELLSFLSHPFWSRTDKVGLQDIHLGHSHCYHCWAFADQEVEEDVVCSGTRVCHCISLCGRTSRLTSDKTMAAQLAFITLDRIHQPTATQTITRNRNKHGT